LCFSAALKGWSGDADMSVTERSAAVIILVFCLGGALAWLGEKWSGDVRPGPITDIGDVSFLMLSWIIVAFGRIALWVVEIFPAAADSKRIFMSGGCIACVLWSYFSIFEFKTN
jgi:hypothetical protein